VASCCDDRHGSQEPSVPGSFVGGQQDGPRKGEKAEEAACAAEPDEPACQSEEAASDGKPVTRWVVTLNSACVPSSQANNVFLVLVEDPIGLFSVRRD
jgi:hypothetical protein